MVDKRKTFSSSNSVQTLDTLKQEAKCWTKEQWKQEVKSLTQEQFATVISEANQPDHLFSAFKTMSDPHYIEIAGSVLQPSQFLELLNHPEIGSLQEKFSSLFILMPPEVFRSVIANATPKQMNTLKKEAIAEPLLHQLTVLSNGLKNDVAAYGLEIMNKERELKELPLENITSSDIFSVTHDLHSLAEKGLSLQGLISQALALAWQTTRMDIIDQLSQSKEHCQKIILEGFGLKPQQGVGPIKLEILQTGLWSVLNNRLDSVFEEFFDPSKHLQDQIPAMEALVKFSVWYLKDYWEIGLLPQIKNESDLELNPDKYSENERLEYREELFLAAQRTLEEHGLFTLADLKSAKIYSRKALVEYILTPTP